MPTDEITALQARIAELERALASYLHAVGMDGYGDRYGLGTVAREVLGRGSRAEAADTIALQARSAELEQALATYLLAVGVNEDDFCYDLGTVARQALGRGVSAAADDLYDRLLGDDLDGERDVLEAYATALGKPADDLTPWALDALLQLGPCATCAAERVIDCPAPGCEGGDSAVSRVWGRR